MAQKSSESKKNRYKAYAASSRKDINKVSKLKRHMAIHPNDAQSAGRVKPKTAGKAHIAVSQLDAAIARMSKTGAHGDVDNMTKSPSKVERLLPMGMEMKKLIQKTTKLGVR